MRKVKTIKSVILLKGNKIDYQTMIEEVVGMEMSRLSCYHDAENPMSCSDELRRAHFIGDCDYEMIIRPIKK